MSQPEQSSDQRPPTWTEDILSVIREISAAAPTGEENKSQLVISHLEQLLLAHEEEQQEHVGALNSLLQAILERCQHGALNPVIVDLLYKTLQRRPSLYTLRCLSSQIQALPIKTDNQKSTTQAQEKTTGNPAILPVDKPLKQPATTAKIPEPRATPSKPAVTTAEKPTTASFIEQRHWSSKNNQNDIGITAPNLPDQIVSNFGLHSLQKTLERQLSDVLEQNRNFGTLLQVEQTTLKNLEGIAEIDVLRQILGNEIDRLLNGQGLLQKKLDNALKYVRILETEGDELSNQLARAHNLSLTDELTKLPNRRAFIRTLEDEVARVQRYGYPLSLALLDLDHFKTINDHHGHSTGDEVLKRFSRCALSAFRHHDMLARYGGEEFAVLLPNTDISGALQAVQKVRSLTQEASVQVEEKKKKICMPTFSGGIVPYLAGETPSEFVERADQALYQAKESGRDRVITGIRVAAGTAANSDVQIQEQPA